MNSVVKYINMVNNCDNANAVQAQTGRKFFAFLGFKPRLYHLQGDLDVHCCSVSMLVNVRNLTKISC